MTQTVDQFLAEWTDAERSSDTDGLDRLLTDDFLGVGPLGFVLAKQAWLGRFGGGLAYHRFDLDELQARECGDAAIVTALQFGSGTIGGDPLPFETVRATLTLIRHDDRWQLAGIHMSFAAGTPGAPPLPSGRRPGEVSDVRKEAMSIQVNHLIVPATDKKTSAQFLAHILGLPMGEPASHFQPVQVGTVTLDYDYASDIRPIHVAFLVNDATFDAAHERLLEANVPIYADPGRSRPGQINHRYGGRGVYFDDPDQHLFELMTAALRPEPYSQPLTDPRVHHG
jgi:ketosteroid isomerase-like protein/catechol 2,3-dioxygenase-like lactoylglutathione lyase family enzyme